MKRASKRLLIPDAPSYLYSANLKDMATKIYRSDLIGKQFGYYTIREYHDAHSVEVICHCGNIRFVRRDLLMRGGTKSCGCMKSKLVSQSKIKHGMCYHPLHDVYENMIRRCHDENNKSYSYYGGRGITVCDEWRSNNVLFFEWALSNGWVKGLRLDRMDNNKGYFPRNCRFIPHKENMRNTRRNTFFEYRGENKTLPEWAEVLNLDLKLLRQRIHGEKWDFERAITQPKKANPNQ